MDVYLESMERIQWQTSSRFALASNHTTINRQDQIKLIGKLSCATYAYTGPPNKRVSVHSVVMGPRPDNVPEDWVIDHIDRDRFNNTRRIFVGLASFNAFNAKRPDSGVSRFRCPFCPEQANRFRAKGGRCSHWQLQLGARAAIASATFYVRKYGSGPKPATCCSLGPTRQALCL
jgi:hypothetical protein